MQNSRSNGPTATPGGNDAPAGRRAPAAWLSAPASVLSSALTLLCPACLPAFGAFLASVGLGFAVSTALLQPALLVLLLVNLAALAGSAARHRHWGVLATGVAGGALVYGGRYFWFSGPLLWAGAAVLIGTALVNFRLKRRCLRCRAA